MVGSQRDKGVNEERRERNKNRQRNKVCMIILFELFTTWFHEKKTNYEYVFTNFLTNQIGSTKKINKQGSMGLVQNLAKKFRIHYFVKTCCVYTSGI